MKFLPYPSYKDSDVDWLGEIPEHWETFKTKYLFRLIVEMAPKNNEYELLSVYTDIGVKPRKELEERGNKASTTDGYFLVKKNDIIVNKLLAWMGAIGISAYDGVTSPAYDVLRPSRKFSSVFFNYLFRCGVCFTEFRRRSRGIMDMRLRLYFDEFGQIQIPFPPLAEQNNIVEFLDAETLKIDGLISKQERLIALSQEKRQALIYHAVTKGLNPNAPRKDSGVAWLGEIPEHWKVSALSYRFEVQLGKMLDEKKITGKHLAPYLRNTDVQWGEINLENLPQMDFSEEDRKKFSLIENDLLVCEGGDIGRCAIWTGEISECYYQKALHRLRPIKNERDSIQFLFYLMFSAAKTGVFTAAGDSSTISHLTAEKLKKHRFPFPPTTEQREIAEYLNRETAKIDALIEKTRQAIKLLQEHRTALISSVVTGKIDVRQYRNGDLSNH